MKQAELETLVQKQAEEIDTLKTGMNWLRSAMHEAQTKMDGQQQTIGTLVTFKVEMDGWIKEFQDQFEEVANELRGQLYGFEPEEAVEEGAESQEAKNRRLGAIARLTELEGLVMGRNRSAPVRRNMVDADAVRVLTGDLKDKDHKTAAEAAGLTYAQVYSCRLEYTFKHVHKDLKSNGWKNPFVKK